MRHHASLAVAGIAVVAFALTGCSTGAADRADDDRPTTTRSAAASTPSPTASATGDAVASGAVTVTSDKIVDDQMGHEVQADQVVRKFPWTSAQSGLADRDDDEQVLVHVTVTAGTKYYSTVDCGTLRVKAHGRTESYASQGTTTVIEDAMRDAGYPPLEKVDQGQSGSGWCAFSVTDPTPTLDLEYVRVAASGNDGTQVTAKDFYAEMVPTS
ncbi:hypothetical protein [Curtobacterium sp. UCD-KPL2560]|uniref:hypothetical protein n=1 Tax=Curtobacterium sp. UCD-KPL2560 TaxID=1885315 RepID=UPI001495722A|nr:hypothetical protein [Curtobacterium sp. UCD-KPL2560]